MTAPAAMTMRAFRFDLDPTTDQQHALSRHFGAAERPSRPRQTLTGRQRSTKWQDPGQLGPPRRSNPAALPVSA